MARASSLSGRYVPLIPRLDTATARQMIGPKLSPAHVEVEGVQRRDWGEFREAGMVYAAIKKAKPTLAGVFWALISKKRFAAAAAIAKSVPGIPAHLQNFQAFDDGAEHMKRRSRDGRVNSKRQSFVITDPSATLKRYIKKRQKNVGLLAASIPSAAGSKFGKLNGVPAWVSRHRSRYGYVRDTKGRNKRTITIGITGKAVKDMQRRFSYVVKYRLAAMERELPYVARAIERKLASQIERA